MYGRSGGRTRSGEVCRQHLQGDETVADAGADCWQQQRLGGKEQELDDFDERGLRGVGCEQAKGVLACGAKGVAGEGANSSCRCVEHVEDAAIEKQL